MVRAHSGPPTDYTERVTRGIIVFRPEDEIQKQQLLLDLKTWRKTDLEIWLQKQLEDRTLKTEQRMIMKKQGNRGRNVRALQTKMWNFN